ncbi:MAG TPA: serine/threonine-protein kinase [Terracidiphilus sp.]
MKDQESTPTLDQWRSLSPLLDEALELDGDDRTKWIRSLEPDVALQLVMLLREHQCLAEEGFLENGAVELPPAHATLAGQTLGVYTLISQIGQGGMGSVWLAERNDGRFDRRVAIKFLNLALMGKAGEERFRREGKILALLAHENIADLIDAGVTSAGQPYLVLEYVDGDQIDRYCNQNHLSVRERIHLFLAVLTAVAKAHSNLIVHRDLKPSNILIRKDNQVKLLDFGIAKLIEGEGDSETRHVFTIGGNALTPEYAAPEQLQGEQITTATDVYALGVLLYLLLTGQHPTASVGRNTPVELVRSIVDFEPRRASDIVAPSSVNLIQAADHATSIGVSPERLRRILRGDLDTILGKALKKDPAERYPSVTAFAEDLRRHLKNQPIGARPDTLAYRGIKFVRRNRVAVSLSLLAFVAATSGLVGTLVQSRTASIQRDLALRQLVRAERTADLNELLLSDVAPMGKPLRADQLLRREESVIEHENNFDAANHIELLLSLGDQYSGEDDNKSALRVLDQAYQLSRHSSDRSIRGKASCVLAAALVPVAELARAETLFQEGMHELGDSKQFPSQHSTCLLSGSEIAYRNGNSTEAIARARASEQALQHSPAHWNLQELNVLINLAGVLGDAGKFREADQTFKRASALMTDLGYDDTQKAVKLFNDWALTLTYDGRQIEAEKIYRRAIGISRTDETQSTIPGTLLYNYASVLRELGRRNEALSYLASAATKAQEANDQILIDQVDLLRARMYTDNHEFGRATELMIQVEPRMRKKFPPNHFAFAALASDRSQLALAAGDIASSLRLADMALDLDEASIKNIGECAAFVPILLIRRSEVELAAGSAKQAEADALHALQLLNAQSESGMHSSNIGRAYLVLAQSLKAESKWNESKNAFQSAFENLQDTLGPEHPQSRAARGNPESVMSGD